MSQARNSANSTRVLTKVSVSGEALSLVGHLQLCYEICSVNVSRNLDSLRIVVPDGIRMDRQYFSVITITIAFPVEVTEGDL